MSFNGGNAFPKFGIDPWKNIKTYHDGMTLRDYFAAKAMTGLLASASENANIHPRTLGKFAYEVADAMLAAREGGREGGYTVRATNRPAEHRPLQQYRMTLHATAQECNDKFVRERMLKILPINAKTAHMLAKQLLKDGQLVLLATHKELAESYQQRFESYDIRITVEPVEPVDSQQ